MAGSNSSRVTFLMAFRYLHLTIRDAISVEQALNARVPAVHRLPSFKSYQNMLKTPLSKGVKELLKMYS